MSHTKKDYIPTDKFELEAWAKSFAKTAALYENHYGINKEEIKTVEVDSSNYTADLEKERQLIEQKRKQVDISQKDRAKLVNTSRSMAQTIKNSPDYTEDIGKEFGIIGSENPFNSDTYKPELTLKKKSHGVEVSFTKSQTDGINLYRRTQGEDNWTFISRDTHSPYVDNKNIISPVKLEYMAWAVINDEEIGIESDSVKITI